MAIVGLALGGLLAASLVTPVYEASTVVLPVSSSSSNGQLGGIGGLTSQLGGLASLTGIQLGGDSKKAESLAVLKSETLTQKFIDDNGLLQVLYSDEWDAPNQRWRVQATREQPTLWKATRDFNRNVRTLETETATGLATVTIAWTDPQQAADWANGLVRLANEYLRDKAIAESERNIAFLNEQAAATGVVEIKNAIYGLLQTEINKAMLARGTDEYAFRVVDPAIPPEDPTYPRRLLWTLLGGFAGLVFSFTAAFGRALLRASN